MLAAAHRLKRANDTPEHHEEWERLHAQFHRTLVAPCKSTWLLRFIEQRHDQFDRYRRLAPEAPETRRLLDTQHGELVSLALERKAVEARELLDDHILDDHILDDNILDDNIQRSYEIALVSFQ